MHIFEEGRDGDVRWVVPMFLKLSFSQQVNGQKGKDSSQRIETNGMESSLVVGYKLKGKYDRVLREDGEVYDVESDERHELYRR